MEDLRYPIGRFTRPASLSEQQRQQAIDAIASTPANLRTAVRGLSDAQLATPYRPEGWTLKQLVHHIPDSHLNAYVRFKLALTEDTPTIKPYDEEKWALLHDTQETPVATSLTMLEALHDRWVRLMRGMSAADFHRPLIHPENGKMTLELMLAMYAWHGAHHVAHAANLRSRMGWA